MCNNFGGRGCGCGNMNGCGNRGGCGNMERGCDKGHGGCDKGHGGHMNCTKTVLPITITSCIKAECDESCY